MLAIGDRWKLSETILAGLTDDTAARVMAASLGIEAHGSTWTLAVVSGRSSPT